MVFERFDQALMNCFLQAKKEREALRRNYLGTDLILPGLLKSGGVASKALHCNGLTFESVKDESIKLDPVQEENVWKEVASNTNLKHVIENSFQRSFDLGDEYIGTEHCLLALIEETDDDGAYKIFENLHTTIGKLRVETLRLWRLKSSCLYALLISDSDADKATLERAYEVLSVRYDPDNETTGDRAMYSDIIRAWSILTDDARRTAYDQASRGTET